LTDDDWSSVKCGCQIRCLQVRLRKTYAGRVFEANLQATRQSQLMLFTAYGGVKWMEKMKMLISTLP